jgi:hypothetical protein
MLQRLISYTIEEYSNSDTSSESEYKLPENLEPELSEMIYNEYENVSWNPEARLQAQFNINHLAKLHAGIKARAQLPIPYLRQLLQTVLYLLAS